jgi:putative phosphoserine phosphatase/1-acylglycerol-3-phosphate O-acyltransferase
VLTTTTPLDLVEPLADVLGFDGVIATRYETRDGHYTGQIAGEFVWGPGKLAAVRKWAAGAGVDLKQSWAYSDSFFDVPLLSNVSQPVAVNPDPRLWAVATARRWPIQYFDVPPGVVKLGPVELQRVVQLIARPELFPWVRISIDGLDNIPRRGPALLVANHRSYFDPLVIGYTLAKVGRPVRFLGKKEVLDAPVVGQVARALGTIRVDRATGSNEPLEAAAEALTSGELVAILPQGTIPRGRAFYDPELRGRWGAARLAAQTKVPVVPIGLWGTERVWPRSSRLPNVLALGHPPTVQVRVGPPVELTYRSVEADTQRIMEAITSLLPAEACVEREPTAEEIALAMPPGRHDDVDADTEAARRPGTD